MIDVRRQEDHYHHRRSWLKTDWHFSFGEYRDPDNMNFGSLRVVNNDRIDGGGGFPTHSHDNMEIITWIIDGALVHEDSTGSKETVGPNGVQTMSAGTGIAHSEYNASKTDPLHLLQIWIEPDERNVEPRYEDSEYTEKSLANSWVPVASGQREAGTRIHQDATVYVRHGPDASEFEYQPGEGRRVYLVAIEGRSRVNDRKIETGDAARIRREGTLEFEADGDTKLLLIDLP